MKRIITILLSTLSLLSVAQIKIGGLNNSNFELNYTDPQKLEIGGITVSGVDFLDENALISLSGLKVGDKISLPGDDISKAIKMLWDQGILGDIELQITKIEGDFVFLNFKLEEKPRLTKFAFEGVGKSEADDLREQIRLIRGRTVTDAILKSTEKKVTSYYIKKGFRNTQVDIVQKKDSILPNSVTLIIKVDKKSKVKIEDIIIKGNTAFTSKKLLRKMKDTKISKPYRVFKSSKALPGAIARDKKNIIALYNSIGYRDATISSDTIYNINDNRVVIGITIDEGPQYYFGNITWTGNFVYDDKVLDKVLAINKGTIYDSEMLGNRLNFNPSGRDVTSLYMDDGYLFFNIQPVEINVNGDSIDIEMRIYEGEQATINKIIVNGNTKTSDHVILRELRTLPGQKFSRSNLIRTQRELSQLGYFDPEQMGLNPIPHPEDGTVDIEYNVTEKANDQFTLSGGWGGFYGFVGTVGLVFNNFAASKLFKPNEYDPLPGGNGQRVSVNMQANGRTFQSYNFSFTEPWLGGKKPNSLTFSLNHSIQKPFDVDNDSTFLKVNGATLYLGRRLQVPDDYFNLSNAISFREFRMSNYGTTSFPISNGKAYNFNFNNTISRYSVGNRPEFPTYGSSFSLSTSFTPPYSLFDGIDNYADLPASERYKFAEYHKWMFDATWYSTLINGKKADYNLVLKTSFHTGFLGTYNNNLGYSPFERFIMGGSGLSGVGQNAYLLGQENIALRGYGDASNIYLDGSGESGNATNANGTKFTKFVAELRYPISLNPMATVYPIAFFEMGNNWDENNHTDFFNLYRSTGIGVRINMPMFGLIGFDYGFALDGEDKRIGTSFIDRGVFHFMIGQQIR